MILVKTFCHCISLQTGTIVIGSLTLGIALVNMVSSAMYLHEANSRSSGGSGQGILILANIVILSILIYSILNVIVSGFLIFGAAKRLSSRIFPWLAISFGSIVIMFCFTLGFSIIAASEWPVGEFFLLLFFLLVATALPIYFWQVVYSFYKELVAEKFGHLPRPISEKKTFSPPYECV